MARNISKVLSDLKHHAFTLSRSQQAANVLVVMTLQQLSRAKANLDDMSDGQVLEVFSEVWHGPAGDLVRGKLDDRIFKSDDWLVAASG